MREWRAVKEEMGGETTTLAEAGPTLSGRRIEISGIVQGVGFRPWVYRLARAAGLSGSVRNDPRGVTIEAFGSAINLDGFLRRLETTTPPAASIRALDWTEISAQSAPAAFTILESGHDGGRLLSIPPELATCADCREEIFDPTNRRYRYPFTNCTNCGPRFTIVLDLPYDRPETTMSGFEMCTHCRAEYEDPADRRFHAQPNACPDCGPQLELWDPRGEVLARREDALMAAAEAVRGGRIVAVQGLGGFHLIANASDGRAVAELRRRKHRPGKPLAVMAPDLAQARRLCRVSVSAGHELARSEAPIVLLPRLADTPLAPEVSVESPYCGVMLPYTPLHHLLLAEIGQAVVATSGNLSDEPIATDPRRALEQLAGIPDLYLVHDRPIARHVDDSIVWFPDGEPRSLRRARGYAPKPLALDRPTPALLAVGAHLKNVIALSRDRQAFLSQHIGDMETPRAVSAFERVIADLLRMLETAPEAVVHDLHPDYPSSRWAARATAAGGALDGVEKIGVQHHHAHLASCLTENEEAGPALGIIFDGTGYGTDATIWGGEILLGDARDFTRVAHLWPFRLPGGDAAVREPRRSALALLWEALGEEACDRNELPPVRDLGSAALPILAGMLRRGFGAPVTSSAGRLFDGVASLLGLHQTVSFEGEAAIALEAIADVEEEAAYPMPVVGGSRPWRIDWRPTVRAILEDRRRGVGSATAAARFHNALAAAAAEVARRAEIEKVALSGGCFQNRLLLTRTTTALATFGLRPLLHRLVPPNDGGISLGQIAVAAARLQSRED